MVISSGHNLRKKPLPGISNTIEIIGGMLRKHLVGEQVLIAYNPSPSENLLGVIPAAKEVLIKGLHLADDILTLIVEFNGNQAICHLPYASIEQEEETITLKGAKYGGWVTIHQLDGKMSMPRLPGIG
ncbi:MAG: hypothetical protein ACYC2T_09855 [Bacillota bacterium]